MNENVPFLNEFKKVAHDSWMKGWHERNGGNISYRLKRNEVEEMINTFYESEWIPVGTTVEDLANDYFLVTGSGKYIRNISLDLESNSGIIRINKKGTHYMKVWGLLDCVPTSELPTHLKSHAIKKVNSNGSVRVVMHSHTTNTIALTFVLPLSSEVFTQELWSVATECPIVFPEGVGVLEWMVPGGKKIANATQDLMREYNVVIWAHHGIFVTGETFDLAFGLMDTVEKSAEILVKILAMGGKKQAISIEQINVLSQDFEVELNKNFNL